MYLPFKFKYDESETGTLKDVARINISASLHYLYKEVNYEDVEATVGTYSYEFTTQPLFAVSLNGSALS